MTRDEWIDHAVAMSQGNPGAAACFADLIAKERYDILEELYMNDIVGVSAYLLYKDVCGYYIKKLSALMKYAAKSEIAEMIRHAEDGHHMTAKNLANVIIIERAVAEDEVRIAAEKEVEERKKAQLRMVRQANYGMNSDDTSGSFTNKGPW